MNCLDCQVSRSKVVPALPGRPWCAKCAPEARATHPPVRHGYFLACTGHRHGDPEYAEEAERLYLALGITDKAAGPMNGVSVYEPVPGVVKRVATLHNFFAAIPEKPLCYTFG